MLTAITERLDSVVNPIFLKEIRQGFRGRGLLLGAGGALLFSIVAFGFSALQSSSSGAGLFGGLSFCMAIVMLVVIPLGLGWQLHKEIGDRTLELIAITSLGSWSNIVGRVLAGGIKLLLTVALMGPFMMSAVLLGGIGFGDVLLTLGFYLTLAFVLCSLSVMLAAVGTIRSTLVGILAGARFLIIPVIAVGSAVALSGLVSSVGGGVGALWFGWSALASGCLSLLFVSTAADLLNPPWVRSYARSKWLAVLVAGVLCAPPVVLHASSVSFDKEVPTLLLILILGVLLIFSMFWAGSFLPDRQSFGIRDRFFSTLIYASAVGATAAIVLTSAGEGERFIGTFTATAIVYFICFAGIARASRRIFRIRHPVFFPGVVVALTVLGCFSSIALNESMGSSRLSGVIILLCPIELVDSSHFTRDGHWLILPAVLGLILSWLGRPTRPSAAVPPAGHG